jgi:DNA excision repair protein ERCC-4
VNCTVPGRSITRVDGFVRPVMTAQEGASAPLPPFLEEALSELVQHDSLLVLAKGLGMHAILRRLVLSCLGPAHLVLLLNTTREEQELLIHELERAGIDDALLPPTINNEWSAAQRVERYLRGGVLMVTARILVVDMLCERLPTTCVDGVLVANAHRVAEASNVAFALRMFRQRRRKGFVRALSDEPGAIMRGFGNVERVRTRLPQNSFPAEVYPHSCAGLETCAGTSNGMGMKGRGQRVRSRRNHAQVQA